MTNSRSAAKGALGGCLGGCVFIVLGLLGAGTASAQMFALRFVVPGMTLLSVVLGVIVGLAIGWMLRGRFQRAWIGALAGMLIGALIGLVADLSIHHEIDLNHGLLLITAFLGLTSGAFAGARYR
jgi:hypothetical protein